jgi:hypothetical protein
MTEGVHEAELVVVEIRLRNGDTLKARTREGADIAGLHRTLQESEFVQVGDDTIVRSADVQSIQLRDRESSGLLDTLLSRVGGGGGDGNDGRERRDSSDRGAVHERHYTGPPIETKPFFLTSEFVLAFLAWIALLLTTLAIDSIDASLFSLLTVAIAAGYMLSRGFAKANTPSAAWDPREDWQPER